jgi:hypothetical protein
VDLAGRRRLAVRLLLCAGVLSAAALAIHGPLPQDPAYHRFADARTLLGVPNLLDVASNLPFLLVGAAGFLGVRRRSAAGAPAGWASAAALLFSVGVAGTALGSIAYHLSPRDETLVWDRLPMSLAFGAFFALIVGDRVGDRAGRRLLVPSLVVSVGSVVLWAVTLRWIPGGDLRLYALAQYLPAIGGVVLLVLVPPPAPEGRLLWAGFAAYAAAKTLELGDRLVFDATGGAVGGHALKHVAAAAAAWLLLRWAAARTVAHPVAPAPAGPA